MMQCRCPAQRARSASRMRHPRGNRDSLLGAGQRAVGVAQMPQDAPQEEVAVGSTVKPITESCAAPFRLIKGDPFLQMFLCSTKLAKPEQGVTHCVVSVPEWLRIMQAFPHYEQLLSGLPSDPNFPAHPISHSQPKQCPEKRPQVCADLAGQLRRPCCSTFALCRSEASRKQRRQQSDLERKLFLVALRALG